MIVRMNRRCFVAIAFATAAVLGCAARESSRSSVSGKVTFDGQPITDGQIVFEPVGSGRTGIAQIADGAYSMPATQGPTKGKYVVRITSNRGTGKMAKATASSGNPGQTEVFEQFIPQKFNDRSELFVEIGDDPQATHDFDLSAN